MTSEILKNDEMKQILKEQGGEISLLLGNGFTLGKQGFEGFAQKNILEAVKDKVKIKSLIDQKSTINQNIEAYLEKLKRYPEFVKFFCDTEYLKRAGIDLDTSEDLLEHCKLLSKEFEDLVADFKTNLLNIFDEAHPKTFNEQADDVGNCVNFMSYFHKIFTINYDLLLYWIIQKANTVYSTKRFKDGFARYVDNRNLLGFSHRYPSMNIHFLHGALHLVHDYSSVHKIKRNSYEKLADIISIIKNDNNLQSLMVIEGTSEEKLSVIEKNFYLFECLDTLRCLKDDLLIHGCSIVNEGSINNDAHLWRSIINSEIKKIYIGVFEEGTNIENIRSVLNTLIRTGHQPPTINFYCSKHFSPWQFDGEHYKKKSIS